MADKLFDNSNQKNNVLQPLYIIYINDVQMESWLYSCCTKVAFKESDADGATEIFEIYFDDPELQVMESNTFIEKKTVIKCKMGYVNDDYYDYIFMGIVQIVENDYPTSGKVTLKITCKDITYSMNESERTKTWKGLTYSSIVKKICESYGVKAVVDSTESILKSNKDAVVNQSGQTDLKFMKSMAQTCKYKLSSNSKSRTVYFVKKKNLPKNVTLEVDYKCGNGKLRAFKPKYNDYDKAMEVKATNYNIENNEVVDGKGSGVISSMSISSDAKADKSSTYTVKSGDSLWSIAKLKYNDGSKFTIIYDANTKSISNPNIIYPGTVLIIP